MFHLLQVQVNIAILLTNIATHINGIKWVSSHIPSHDSVTWPPFATAKMMIQARIIGTLHIKIKDMAYNKRYGSMDLLLELLLVLLLLLQLYVFVT